MISDPDDEFFFLEKSIDDKIIYTSGNKIHKITKRIHYMLDNINKMNNGSIKTYELYNELEIEVLTQYLAYHGIKHVIYVDHKNTSLCTIINMNKFRTNRTQYSQYFTRDCNKIEYNKIKKNYRIEIEVSK
jgi:hypothetical protein